MGSSILLMLIMSRDIWVFFSLFWGIFSKCLILVVIMNALIVLVENDRECFE